MARKRKVKKDETKIVKTVRRGRPKKVKVSEEVKEVKTVHLKKASTLSRFEGNPIISPNPKNEWECWQTFNPGAIVLNNKIHLLYRAIGNDEISRFGYANSKDGFHIDERLSYPVYQHPSNNKSTFSIYSYTSGGSWNGAEDPRITRVEDENRLYVTYTACDDGLRVALTSIKISDFLNKKWNWAKPVMISPPGEVNKNWVIFPKKINGKYAILHSITPKILVSYFDKLYFDGSTFINSNYSSKLLLPKISCRKRRYEKEIPEIWIKGAGPTPIETKYGWLIFFHTIENGKYAIRAMITKLNQPESIVCISNSAVLKPEYPYEMHGFKPEIVYINGAVVKNNLLILYYGASDNYVCVASAPFDEFLEDLISGRI
jgi:predicted GH43/DUF377 family glycosyl hydrolase